MFRKNDEIRLTQFGEYLLKSHLVSKGKEVFLVMWVRKFLQRRSQWPSLSWSEQLRLFTDTLGSEPRIEKWQVDQAEKAVRIFYNNFLSESEATEQALPLISIDKDGRFSPGDALASFREALRLKNYAYRTEETYLSWCKRLFAYAGRIQGDSSSDAVFISEQVIRDFLAQLALKDKVSASTQNLAFNSVLAFCRMVLKLELHDFKESVRANHGKRLPVVFSLEEMERLLHQVEGTIGLMLKIIYGGGLRLTECLRLRVKDIDFEQGILFIRAGKGDKDRATLLPDLLHVELRDHLIILT